MQAGAQQGLHVARGAQDPSGRGAPTPRCATLLAGLACAARGRASGPAPSPWAHGRRGGAAQQVRTERQQHASGRFARAPSGVLRAWRTRAAPPAHWPHALPHAPCRRRAPQPPCHPPWRRRGTTSSTRIRPCWSSRRRRSCTCWSQRLPTRGGGRTPTPPPPPTPPLPRRLVALRRRLPPSPLRPGKPTREPHPRARLRLGRGTQQHRGPS